MTVNPARKSVINAQTKNHLKAEELAKIIGAMRLPPERTGQIFNFFTDVPVQDIDRFAAVLGIADIVLKRYYEEFIKDVNPNQELEEMLRYAQ
ncbi:hypothetical protein SY88_07850 [Clostridiales bacterium PH28_bin88]|nr:hypothetical protein SY88_07850 [Clostridiales bacterium PH28_bin88]